MLGSSSTATIVTITDLASTHGTLLNGKRVDSARLANGDVVQLGGVLLVLHTGAIPTPRPGDSLWRTASAMVEPPARAPTGQPPAGCACCSTSVA